MYQKLSKSILGGKISNISRVCDLVCIQIETCNEVVCIHIQSFFRFLKNGNVVISSNDIYNCSDKFNDEDFEWDVPGKSVFDESLNLYKKDLFNISILKIKRNRAGDLKIIFQHGYVLEILIDTIKNEEKYRIFNQHIEYIR